MFYSASGGIFAPQNPEIWGSKDNFLLTAYNIVDMMEPWLTVDFCNCQKRGCNPHKTRGTRVSKIYRIAPSNYRIWIYGRWKIRDLPRLYRCSCDLRKLVEDRSTEGLMEATEILQSRFLDQRAERCPNVDLSRAQKPSKT